MLSKLIVLIMLPISAHALDFSKCSPEEIGIYRADDPAYEYADVKWYGKTYRKYFKGRVADHGKNQAAFDEWVLSLPENDQCNPSKS